jgi:NitT/TauT family transport system ATP-binding protein
VSLEVAGTPADVTEPAGPSTRPPAAPPVVDVRAVSRSFRAGDRVIHALGPVDLTVGHDEFVSLIGPSGCGKSTLLNIVAGLLPPTDGDVCVSGHPVDGTPAEVGMMLQDAVLLEWRTAKENVLLPVEITGGRRAVKAAESMAGELLDLVGLVDFDDKYPHELSGGMQQRVAICRMLIGNPGVLLLDEPFGALDEITREHMNVELERIFDAQAKAALFVTHNIQEAVFLSDRVVVMTERPGRIAGLVDVDLPRPRDPDIVTSAEFQVLVAETRRLLNLGSGPRRVRSSDGAGGPEVQP